MSIHRPDKSFALKHKIHEIIFEAETPAGKIFDVGLLIAILSSLLITVIETVPAIHNSYGHILLKVEWLFTGIFTLEYLLRLYCVRRPSTYAKSFYGLVDLLAVVPTYLGFFIGGAQSFLVIRGIRLLRVFRIFKLVRFSIEAEVLMNAIRASRPKVVVFVGAVMTLVTIMGALMYLIEGETHGFTDIPTAMYWAVVTMTTVGYGDLVPQTALGKIVSSVMMIMGYGLIAVPTGIVSVELAHASKLSVSTITCGTCAREGHELDAVHCRFCGQKL